MVVPNASNRYQAPVAPPSLPLTLPSGGAAYEACRVRRSIRPGVLTSWAGYPALVGHRPDHDPADAGSRSLGRFPLCGPSTAYIAPPFLPLTLPSGGAEYEACRVRRSIRPGVLTSWAVKPSPHDRGPWERTEVRQVVLVVRNPSPQPSPGRPALRDWERESRRPPHGLRHASLVPLMPDRAVGGPGMRTWPPLARPARRATDDAPPAPTS